MNDYFDGRFATKKFQLICIGDWLMEGRITTKDIILIKRAAEKLEIEDIGSKPAVDVLYEIAGKLSILESKRITPEDIMNRIKQFLETN